MANSQFLRRQAELTDGSRPFSFDLVQGSCFPDATDWAAASAAATIAIAGEACTIAGSDSYLVGAKDANLSPATAMTAVHEDGPRHGKRLD